MIDPTEHFQRQWEDMDPATEEINKMRAEIERLRALIAEMDRLVMWEALGTGQTFSESVECFVQHGGPCPTVAEAYSGARRCAEHQ